MNEQIKKISKARKVDAKAILKKGIWLAIVMVSIIYSMVGSLDDLNSMTSQIHRWVYIYLNFGSFVLGIVAAIIIFWRKPNDWMAFITSLMLVTFTSTDSGFRFWYLALAGEFLSSSSQFVPLAYAVALFFSVLYMGLLTTTLVYVLLTFPDGKLASRGPRWFFIVMVVSQIILIVIIGMVSLLDVVLELNGDMSYFIYAFLDTIKSLILIPLAIWQIYRLGKISNPVQRQQIKWISVSLIGMTLFYAIGSLINIIFDVRPIPVWTFLPMLVFTYGFIVTFLIAIERYRLWDMDSMINKAMVYTSLTGILTAIGFGGAVLLDYYAKQYLEENSPLVGALILLPLAALFYPVRNGMQFFVDRYFKPEEVDFGGTIVEFTSDAQLMLSPQDILRILARQATEQLNVANASIFLKGDDGQLLLSEPLPLSGEAGHLDMEDKTRLQLEKGNTVVPGENASYSLFIPLVIKRASRPDFLGVLALGPRNNGTGYSTDVLKSLKNLGAEAGKAIYISQLRERMGLSIMDRLAAIEKGLLVLHKTTQV